MHFIFLDIKANEIAPTNTSKPSNTEFPVIMCSRTDIMARRVMIEAAANTKLDLNSKSAASSFILPINAKLKNVSSRVAIDE